MFARFDVRMARFLLSVYEKTGENKIQMTQEAIAKEVNSAREVVARMLKQFASDELIELNRGAIVIKNIEGLDKEIYLNFAYDIEGYKIEPLIFSNQKDNYQHYKIKTIEKV